MFAGPNGSGKSVLKSYLPKELLGVYLNADEMELTMRHCGSLDLRAFGVATTTGEVLPFFTGSDLLRKQGLYRAGEAAAVRRGPSGSLRCDGGFLLRLRGR